MAVGSAYNFKITVASSPGSTSQTDLSDHCIALVVNMPLQANEAQAAGNVHKVYRAGAGDPSIEATFRNDHSTQSVSYLLTQHISITSTGFGVTARVVNATRTSANPEYSGEMIISGDLKPMDHNWGEIPAIGVKFVPFGTFSIVSTTT